MSGLFSKPRTPAVVAPAPMPAVETPKPVVEDTGVVEDEEVRLARQRKGRRKTLLTGELEPMVEGKKRLLGG